MKPLILLSFLLLVTLSIVNGTPVSSSNDEGRLDAPSSQLESPDDQPASDDE